MTSVPLRWWQRLRDRNLPDAAPDDAEDRAPDQPTAVRSPTEGPPTVADDAPAAEQPGPAQPTDRSAVIGRGLQATATWSVRLVVVGIALYLLFWLLGRIWVGVGPILLALVLSTVLHPPVAWLRRHGWPAGLAAAAVMVSSFAFVGAVFTFVARPIGGQSAELVDSAARGLQSLQGWVTGPPLNLRSEQLNDVVDLGVDRLQSSASQIAAGLFTGVSVVGSALITVVLVLVLSFFFIKDGDRFLPWARRELGDGIGGHLTEVCTRSWRTLGSFIQVQAVVSLVDAVFIGLGLFLLGVPLALALALLTFVAGFVPIVGALTAGALAVLVALVSNGPTTALLVLALILVVQQLESNVLQPVLQGRSLQLHAAVVLLAVTVGGTVFGIIGAFLAVPVAAVAAALLRYLSEQVSLRSGQVHAGDVRSVTPEGFDAARRGEQAARRLLGRRGSGQP
ncbi:AI-2E family transporter [Microlunatus lacustris]